MGRIATYKRIVLIVCALAGVSVSSIAHANFTQTLKEGDTHPEVKQLQVFLNTRGFTIAEIGPGSAGQETETFGPATKSALIRFQETYRDDVLTPAGLTSGNGYFGPYSVAKANALLVGTTSIEATPHDDQTKDQSSGTPPPKTTSASTTRYLTEADLDKILKRIDRNLEKTNDRIKYSSPIKSLTGVTLGDATFEDTDASFDLLSVSGNTSLATLTVTATTTLSGRIVITSNTAPADTTDTLYNVGGDLYWAGNLLAGSEVGTWASDGTNVWRAGGNVGIGTTTLGSGFTNTAGWHPLTSTSLTVDGSIYTQAIHAMNNFSSFAVCDSNGYPCRLAFGWADNTTNHRFRSWGPGNTSLSLDIVDPTNHFFVVTGLFNAQYGARIGYYGDSATTTVPTNGLAVAGNVGIGTTSPYAKLSVTNTGTGPSFTVEDQANDTSPFVIDASGNVGIGTTAPSGKLDVYGSVGAGYMARLMNTADSTNGKGLYVQAGTNNGFGTNTLATFADGDGTEVGSITHNIGTFTYSGSAALKFNTNATERMVITSTGNVGIGTAAPSQKLTVSGDVYASSFIDDGITLTAPDYVFDDPNYFHLSLADIEASTIANAHLPWLTPRGSGPMALSERINEILEALENLFLHVFDLAKRLIVVEQDLEQVKNRDAIIYETDDRLNEHSTEIGILKAEIAELEAKLEALGGARETPQSEEDTPPTAPAQGEEKLGAVGDEEEPIDPEPTTPASIEVPAEAEPPTEEPQPTAPPA